MKKGVGVWGDEQVYMMDKRLVDPRRPHGAPTAEDKAEGLIPYAAELPVEYTGFATYDLTVARLSGGRTLSSTCFHIYTVS